MKKKVTASIQKKKGSNKLYIVVGYYTIDDKRKQKWISTGLDDTEENQVEAELQRLQVIKDFEKKNLAEKLNVKVIDFYRFWIAEKKKEVEENTYEAYEDTFRLHIEPYWKSKTTKMMELTTGEVQKFYDSLLKDGMTSGTLSKVHSNFNNMCKLAVLHGYLTESPAHFTKRPKPKKFHSDTLNSIQIKTLFVEVENTKMEPVVILTGFYGLRRSEVLGLRFSRIDFVNDTIKIRDKVIRANGKYIFIEGDTKNDSSSRDLPLSPSIKKYLLNLKAKSTSEFVCHDEYGHFLKGDYVTKTWKKILRYNCLPDNIRFDDLRHGIVSILEIESDDTIEMHEVSSLLGHSSIKTTSDIYGNMAMSGKRKTVEKIEKLLGK